MHSNAEEPHHADRGRPRITVVIPFHNRAKVLLRAIESVLRQDLADFELLVVDDGSTDGSASLVAEIADPRVHLIREEVRRGANAARNRGLLTAKAPIVSFLDSDDEYEPHKLSTVVAMFDRQPDLGTLVDSYAIVNPRKHAGRPEDLINPVIETSAAFICALFDSTVKSRRVRKSASGISVRRKVALRAGLFDDGVKRRQDMEFLIRLAKTARCATTDLRLWTKHEQLDSISYTGGGFIAATLLMGRAHPEYTARRAFQPADIVIYMWESFKRRRYEQLGRDLRLLSEEIGAFPTLSLIGRGFWAWQVDPVLGMVLRRLRRDGRSKI